MADYKETPLFNIGDKVKIKFPKETRGRLNLNLYDFETNSCSNIIITEEDTYFVVDIRKETYSSGKSAEKGCIDVLHESVCHGNQ